jgi:hypothetical protein
VLGQVEKQKRAMMIPAPRLAPDELLGYPLPSRLRRDMEAMDLTSLPACGAERLWMFASADRREYAALLSSLRDRAGNPPRARIVPDDTNERPDAVLLSTRILQTIAATLAGDQA